jgi:hypothetical protein
MMYRILALVEKCFIREGERNRTDYMAMTDTLLTLEECDEWVGTMNYNLSDRRNYHYFIVSEEEYQSYWKDKVS